MHHRQASPDSPRTLGHASGASVPADLAGRLFRAPDEVLAACPTVPACRDILLRRYEKEIRACARRMSLDGVDAEDLAQETYVRVLQALPAFEGRSSFNTWLSRIAANSCVDHFRRGKTRQSRRYEPRDHASFWAQQVDRSPLPADLLFAKTRACHLDEAIAKLPREQRAVVELALVAGLPQSEIAERLDLTVEAMKGRLKRARVRLRRQLEEPSVCPLCAGLGGFRIRADGSLE